MNAQLQLLSSFQIQQAFRCLYLTESLSHHLDDILSSKENNKRNHVHIFFQFFIKFFLDYSKEYFFQTKCFLINIYYVFIKNISSFFQRFPQQRARYHLVAVMHSSFGHFQSACMICPKSKYLYFNQKEYQHPQFQINTVRFVMKCSFPEVGL